ncbi:IclR family transcriptional regulator [Hoyosella altamirensis]|uniref:Glycerol operon regulatory protein n=1 Tax=Hoyosella altamirensis TaxID=616997 RepID=A0A839RPA2_9ACTN|nr:IclR family transcriptional regulator [Hoyosella altamirensis]MBB3038350.1 DNA-binding IclR family transcriptional regulator [Hoyosella altamirensis]
MPGLVQSVERAAALLRLLAAEREPLGLNQICGALGIAKATAHGLLKTLIHVGFVEQHPESGKYRLAPDPLTPESVLWDVNEIRSRSMNWADALAARTGQTTRLAAFRDGQLVIVHHVFRTDSAPQTSTTGATLPLHATALGKVLLAHDARASRSLGVEPLPAIAFRTITDRTALARELAQVRDLGWAAAIQELAPDAAAIAAPMRDEGGAVIAAIGIEGPLDDICTNRGAPRPELIEQVTRAAHSISHDFGHGRSL